MRSDRPSHLAFAVIVLPFLALLSGPARLLLRVAPFLLTVASIGALAEFVHTGLWSDFIGIWECGALLVLVMFARGARWR